MPVLKKILVPVDYSETARSALEYAMFLAQKFEAAIEVLHVLEVPPHVGAHTVVKTKNGEQKLSEMLRNEATAQSEKFLAPFVEAGTVTIAGHFVEGTAAKSILKRADDAGFDMIVMGTHGRSGIRRLIMGSVADNVVRCAACPVVTVCKSGTAADE